jgi:gamma-glutamyl-gamma-aminobutyraldehyde dehydrogenase/4-guanidinobutyraldehyde dehydrogenase/NAD-dependent aldehyde dehydrogenase
MNMTELTFDGRAFINGERVAARDVKRLHASPVDGRVLTNVARCSVADQCCCVSSGGLQ